MTVANGPIAVDANTRRTSAGADWYPRRNIQTGRVCWFYGPRLTRGVELATAWCDQAQVNIPAALTPNTALSVDLAGGTPCPECDAQWSLT